MRHRLRLNTAHAVDETDVFSSLSLTLNSPNTADHMASYGPAFYQSYGASGQFTHEFDGEQLFSVELKKREAVWRLPEFGDFTYFDPQGGLASIAVIRAHLDVLVERSNRTRAINSMFLALRLTPCPSVGQGRPRKPLPHLPGLYPLWHSALRICGCGAQPFPPQEALYLSRCL